MVTVSEASKEVVQRSFDALNDQEREPFVEGHADDAVLYAFGEEYHGIDEIAANEFSYFEAFPDLVLTPETILAEGETVAAHWTIAGTHDGEFNGIAPTGAEVEFTAMGIFRVDDGRIAEVWLVADQLRLMQQLGTVDPPTE